MLSLTSARAAFMLYQNARAVTGAADHLSRYLIPLLREWSATDAPLAHKLELLGARADSVWPVLDFLLEYSSDKGSSVQCVLMHARDTLHGIERFLASLNNASTVAGVPKARVGGAAGQGVLSESEKEALMHTIHGHLRELDFSLSSLSLAVQVINAAAAMRPVLPAAATFAAGSSSGCIATAVPSPSPDPPRYISPSCLLRASERMRSMGAGGGDLVMSHGSLYRQTVQGGGRSFTDAIRRAQETPASTHGAAPRWTVPMPPVADVHHTTTSALADDVLEEERRAASRPLPIAVKSAGGRVLVSREGDSPSGRWVDGATLPDVRVGSVEQDLDDGWSAVGQGASPPSHGALAPALQSSPMPPMTSPRVAQPASQGSLAEGSDAASSVPTLSPWTQLFPSASLKIVRNESRSLYELHVTDVGLSSDSLARHSTLKFDLSASLSFRSTSSALLGLTEDAHAKRGLSASIDAVFTFDERIANSLQTRYAFMIHGLADTAGSVSAQPAAARDSPLDIAYLARLCCYENLHADSRGAFSSTRSVHLGPAMTQPLAHTRASDEELWLLLAGIHLHGEPSAKQSIATAGPNDRADAQATTERKDAEAAASIDA